MEDFQKKFILALLAYASQRGIEPQRLCTLAGLNYKSLLSERSKPVSAEQIDSLWRNAAYLATDDLFGLHFGESMQLAALGIIGQIVQTSATVGEAMSNACAMVPLLTNMFTIRIHHTKTTFRIIFTGDSKKTTKFASTYQHMGDFLLAFTMHELKGLVMERITPLQSRYPYMKDNLSAYTRVLGPNLTRKVDEAWIEFPKSLLDLKILSANYELQNHLLNQVSTLMNGAAADGSFHKKVYNYLLSNSFLYSLSVEAVAANYNMSVRSLQRKLKDEGITFLEIVDAVRMALAITYLKSGTYQVKDIAFALGYSEQTAFVRAFKRWTGQTPVTYKTTIQNHN